MLAVRQADGGAQFVLRDVLEFLQVLSGLIGLSGLLVGAGEAELGRGVERVDFQRMLEGIQRFGKLLELRVGRAEEVPGVGVVGIDFCDVAEGFDCLLRNGRILEEETEVVPGVRVFRVVLGRFLEQGFRFVDALQVQQGHSAVECGHFQVRVFGGGTFEGLQALLK